MAVFRTVPGPQTKELEGGPPTQTAGRRKHSWPGLLKPLTSISADPKLETYCHDEELGHILVKGRSDDEDQDSASWDCADHEGDPEPPVEGRQHLAVLAWEARLGSRRKRGPWVSLPRPAPGWSRIPGNLDHPGAGLGFQETSGALDQGPNPHPHPRGNGGARDEMQPAGLQRARAPGSLKIGRAHV